VRYRTAAILCFVLIGGMFVFPAVVKVVLLPSLEQNPSAPIPTYARILLAANFFCGHWRWFLVLPMVWLGLVFTTVELANRPQARE